MTGPTDLEILEGSPVEALDTGTFWPSWLIATGQDQYLRWMMLMTLTGVGFGVLRWVGGTSLLGLPSGVLSVFGAAGALLICGGLLLLLVIVRCRSCGCRVALHFIRTSNFSRWLHDLQAATACPKCGHHPQASS